VELAEFLRLAIMDTKEETRQVGKNIKTNVTHMGETGAKIVYKLCAYLSTKDLF
jgi:hypothetical protein